LPFDLTDYTLTVTTVAGDGGIWLRSTETSPYNGDSILLVVGGNGYGQGGRGGDAGTSIYFGTSSNGAINEVEGVLTPGDTYTVAVKAEGSTYSVYLTAQPLPSIPSCSARFRAVRGGLYNNQPKSVSGSGSGPPTTYSNFSLTGEAVPPRISSFSPDSGAVGVKSEDPRNETPTAYDRNIQW